MNSPNEGQTEERLGGSIAKVVFHSEETGFCVLKVKARGHVLAVSVVGTLPKAKEGETIEAVGAWHQDRKFGAQFKSTALRIVPPSTMEGMEKYLASGMVKGIGSHFASKLVEAFGDETFEVIQNSPEKLLELPGIGRKRMAQVTAAWKEQKAVQEILVFLQSYGIGASRAFRIYKKYGESAILKISENPYRLCFDIQGIGFTIADSLAVNLGIDRHSQIRARAGVLHVLEELAGRGNCLARHDDLVEEGVKLLGIAKEVIEDAIFAEIGEKRLVREDFGGGDCIYLAALHDAERGVAEHLTRLLRGRTTWAEIDAAGAIPEAEEGADIELAPSQRQAVETILKQKVAVLTGGPGTGKTTVLNTLLKIIETKGPEILLCAPTGRAAKRMTESTGMEACTIHRLLEFNPGEGGFQKDEVEPLEAGLVVVDEASMLDITLMNALLRAIPDGAGLILVGDIDQLPSVGPGNVLKDVISSGAVPTVRLTEIFRQGVDSRIVLNAHRINRGELPVLPEKGERSDFYFIETASSSSGQEMILEVVTNRIPKAFDFDPVRDIQVLTPMHKGPLGTKALNIEMQKRLNPASGPKVERFGMTYAGGDKVMVTANNYEKEVFNGDIGTIVRVDAEEGEVAIDFEGHEVLYDFPEMDEITLAYCTTIHKSQGSEYPVVVMPLANEHHVMLERNLLYTGVTRGQKLVVIVGQSRALATAVKTVKARARLSNLADRLGGSPE